MPKPLNSPLTNEKTRRNLAGARASLHGRFTAVLPDAARTNCMFAHGLVCMTGELNVRFRHVVQIGRPAYVRAWLERSSRRPYFLRARLERDGKIRAMASAKFLELSPDQQTGGDGGFHG
jgi:hypothetical protein